MINKNEFMKNVKEYVKVEYQARYNLEDAISKCYATNSNLCEIRSTYSKSGTTVAFEIMDLEELD